MKRGAGICLCCLLALGLVASYPACGPATSKAAEESVGPKKKKKAKSKSAAASKKGIADDTRPAPGEEGEKESSRPKKPAAKNAQAENEPAADDTKQPAAAKKDADKQKPTSEKKESTEAKKDATRKPSISVVKPGPLKIELTLEGIFEAQNTSEVLLRPQEWSGLSVLSAVEHGATVKVGDLLVALDPEKIDRTISDLRSEQQVSELAVQQAEQNLQTLEALTPLDLAASRRAQRNASEDEKLFNDVNRPWLLKTNDFVLKTTQQFLEYQEEELRQLEKMYKADEITEETEKIVLKRAHDQVDQAKFMAERAEVDHDQIAKMTVPRMDEKVKESAERTALQWEKDKAALPLALKKQRLDLEKLKLLRTRSEERLNKLLADRALMTVKAPADGIVYYGRCLRGKWTSGLLGDGLRRGATIAPNEVFMTIVRPRPMFIRASTAEKDLQAVRPGVKGTVKATGYPDLKLTAIVDRVAAIPAGSGGFDTRLTVALDPQAEPLMPGMTCSVKLIAYEKKDALTVPPAALSTDEQDAEKHYVYLTVKDGPPRKQEVTLGKRSEKQVEILSGLSAGDEVLLEPPKEKK